MSQISWIPTNYGESGHRGEFLIDGSIFADIFRSKISGAIVQITNCLLSINMLVPLVIARVLLVVKLQLSTDFELVMHVSPTLTFYRMTINQPVALVDIRLQSVIYSWTVLIYKMSETDSLFE